MNWWKRLTRMFASPARTPFPRPAPASTLSNDVNTKSSPKHDFVAEANDEKRKTIAILSKSNTKSEILSAFEAAAAAMKPGAGADSIIKTYRTIATTGDQFSEKELQDVRDDAINNAKAFISATEVMSGRRV